MSREIEFWHVFEHVFEYLCWKRMTLCKMWWQNGVSRWFLKRVSEHCYRTDHSQTESKSRVNIPHQRIAYPTTEKPSKQTPKNYSHFLPCFQTDGTAQKENLSKWMISPMGTGLLKEMHQNEWFASRGCRLTRGKKRRKWMIPHEWVPAY